MSRLNLRRKPRISYYEPDEPNFDEYLYCDKCADYVYEYCSIHGPLLVIPDDKVPVKSNFPSYVPRAALTIPHVFLHIAPSIIPGAGLGIFSSLTLPCGVRFGPYVGDRSYNPDSMYCWQIYDKNNKPSYVVDAADPNKSNWMRYVNCARHWNEQNLIAYQYQGQLYYRTIRTIPKFTELMVFYGSEFAHSLRVDLRRYNTLPIHKNIGAPPAKKLKVIENCKETKPEAVCTKPLTENLENISSAKTKLTDKHTIQATKAVESKPTLQKKNIVKTKSTFPCNHCKQHFATKILLSDHLKVHVPQSSDTVFICRYCQYKADSQESLNQHLLVHDIKKQSYICDICGYRFKSEQVLNDHVAKCCNQTKDRIQCSEKTNKVNGEKRFSCTVCHYKCSVKCNLKTHKRTHTGEKPFSCTECDFKCSVKKNLVRHSRIHTGEKPFLCSVCDYKCTQKHNLVRHLRIHTGEKPFLCTVCDYKCTQKQDLVRHSRIHTGEKPFLCTVCDYKCSVKHHLVKHSRIHTGEKPFLCTECDFKFSVKSSLKRHMRIH